MTDHTDSLEFEIPENAVLAVEGYRGIYCAQTFAELYGSQLLNVEQSDIDVLLQGPDNEQYWDVWDFVESNAKVVLKNPWQLATIYQDENIWLIPCEDKQS